MKKPNSMLLRARLACARLPWALSVGLPWIGLLCLLSGCALSSKGEALTPRYFTPAPADRLEPRSPEPPSADRAPAPELRIGRVEPAAHLEERIAYRLSATELAYYEDRRWTEPPEQFVRRALELELFERRAFQRVVSGAAPTLDVEVLRFEELREKPPRARLSLLITLRDERHALLERTVSVDAPFEATGDAGPALAAAMASALGEATEQVAEQVAAQLAKADAASVAQTPRSGAAANGPAGAASEE